MTVALFTPIIDGYIFGFLYTEKEQHLPLVTYSWEKLQKPEEQKFSVTYNSIEFSSSEDNGIHTLISLKPHCSVDQFLWKFKC